MLGFSYFIVNRLELDCPFDIEPSWKEALKGEWDKPYMAKLLSFLEQERASGPPIYPPKELVFSAFWLTPYNSVKVVIVGQDPYFNPGQAQGLAFSVPPQFPLPPSLKNIYKELAQDLDTFPPTDGCLIHWAKQGVFLLNTTLTVREGSPLSHHGKGWELFTDAVILKLCERKDPVIFVLWGQSAQKKIAHIQQCKDAIVISSSHPSPLGAYQGFFGSKPFSKINQFLKTNNKAPINWV